MEKTLAGKQKRVQNSRLFFKVCFLMFALVALQLLVFVVVLLFSGEFSAIKRFSYNVLLEKTQNRAGYIENLLNRKPPLCMRKLVRSTEPLAGFLSGRERPWGRCALTGS